MAMGNYCYKSGTECGYANTLGNCIFEEHSLCEMEGDVMPDKLYPFGSILYKPCTSYAGKKNFINPIIVKEVYAKDGFAIIEGYDVFRQVWSTRLDKMIENHFYSDKNVAENALMEMIKK